jgi:hypothetical protein
MTNLYKVKRGDKEILILSTIHTEDPKLFPIKWKEIIEEFAPNVLYTEINTDESNDDIFPN